MSSTLWTFDSRWKQAYFSHMTCDNIDDHLYKFIISSHHKCENCSLLWEKNWHRTCLRCLNFFVTLPWTWVTQQISLLFSRTPKRHRLFDLKNITPGRFCKEMLLNVRVWSRSLFEKLDFTRNYNICLKHHMSTRCRDSAHRSISLSMTLIWQYVILG